MRRNKLIFLSFSSSSSSRTKKRNSWIENLENQMKEREREEEKKKECISLDRAKNNWSPYFGKELLFSPFFRWLNLLLLLLPIPILLFSIIFSILCLPFLSFSFSLARSVAFYCIFLSDILVCCWMENVGIHPSFSDRRTLGAAPEWNNAVHGSAKDFLPGCHSKPLLVMNVSFLCLFLFPSIWYFEEYFRERKSEILTTSLGFFSFSMV